MATHSIILAWEIPWTEEPGGLQSMGLHDTFISSHLQFLSSVSYNFQSTGILPPWLTIFLGILYILMQLLIGLFHFSKNYFLYLKLFMFSVYKCNRFCILMFIFYNFTEFIC